MKIILTVLVGIFGVLGFAKPAHAIIVLPAVVLIPIAKIVAIVIAWVSLPTLGIGALVSKLWGKSYRRGLLISGVLVLVLGITLVVVLKLLNPEQPIV